MVWHLSHSRALHERLFVLTVETESIPWINDAKRLTMTEIGFIREVGV
jgi:KUP system potassium uptake protein